MRSSKPKGAVVPVSKQIKQRTHWTQQNAMVFPQALRDAIPGPELPGCDRSLVLASIDGGCSHTAWFGRRVVLNLRVEETGKLTGAFDIKVNLNVDAARALAATLAELIQQAEKTPQA